MHSLTTMSKPLQPESGQIKQDGICQSLRLGRISGAGALPRSTDDTFE